jgi:hypothetical protein
MICDHYATKADFCFWERVIKAIVLRQLSVNYKENVVETQRAEKVMNGEKALMTIRCRIQAK